MIELVFNLVFFFGHILIVIGIVGMMAKGDNAMRNFGSNALLLLTGFLIILALLLPSLTTGRRDIPPFIYECAGDAARRYVYTAPEWIFIRGYTLEHLPEKEDITFVFSPVSFFGVPFPAGIVTCGLEGSIVYPISGERLPAGHLLLAPERVE